VTITLTVVGCSGSTSGKDSPASSYLVQAPYQGRTFSLVLDLGPGAFGALYNYVEPSEVDAIALSHLHPDHCLDVCAFYVAARYSDMAHPWPPRPLYAPPGAAERLAAAYEVPGAVREPGSIAGYFGYRDWQRQQQIGPFTVTTARVDHPVEAYAVRVVETAASSGAALVYSGDTGPCDSLVELAKRADLFLVESAFLDDASLADQASPDEHPGSAHPAGLHLTPRQAAEAGARAEVKRVVLTHIPPWHDPEVARAQALPHFEGAVVLATAGRRFSIG
jgi:ribonuclease BN (tRNA processing enzyme)